MSTLPLLPERDLASLRAAMPAVDPEAAAIARRILDDVRSDGAAAVRRWAEQLGDLEPGAPLVLDRNALLEAAATLPPEAMALLERTAARIGQFAQLQRGSIQPVELDAHGVRCGQEIAPVQRAGCYAPGGRYPLPSSVLMTAVTARAAGVAEVWVASPRPTPITLAAAAVAGADGLIAAGGAQGIAALALGCESAPPCDVVVGPGNRFVTAAKQQLFGQVGLDGLAGPSELAVLADHTADPGLVAADLLAQAEHDPDARPVLLTDSAELIPAVRAAAKQQLLDLPTAAIARVAMQRGGALLAGDLAAAARAADSLAAEHLALHVADPAALRALLHHYGALFLGAGCAEVLGDYGAGPNHVLPTGNTARFTGGLSVFSFLRIRTWMAAGSGPAAGILEDAAQLARLEGLEAHARAALRRRPGTGTGTGTDPGPT